MRTRPLRFVHLAILLAIIAQPALADTSARASRADIARIYLQLDRDYMLADDLSPERRRTLNRDFDRATAQFFSGDAPRAVASLLGLLSDLAPPDQRDAARASAGVLARFTPPIIRADHDTQLTLRLAHADDTAPDAIIEFSITDPDGDIIWTGTPALPTAIDLGELAPSFIPGRHLLLAEAGGIVRTVAFFDVVTQLPEDAARSLEARLDACQAPTPELSAAIELARSRLALLRNPDDVQRLLNPAEATRTDIESEVEALEQGENPYESRTGHLWATLSIRGRDIPFRIYVPARTASPMPLVIALHGAGGDENLFPSAYGGAELTRLAEESGFILAAPSTYLLFGAPEVASEFIDAMSVFAPVDQDRVYAIGHSLGGIAASSLARSIPDRLAAACCLAGVAPLQPGPAMCPLLVYSAEFDIIVPDARIRPIAQRLINANEPVEYRLAKDEGHTLMVGPLLRPSIQWLLTHTRQPRETEPLQPPS